MSTEQENENEKPKLTINQAMAALVRAIECCPMSDHARAGDLQFVKDYLIQEEPAAKAADEETPAAES